VIAQHVVTRGGRAITVFPDGKAYPANKHNGEYYQRQTIGAWDIIDDTGQYPVPDNVLTERLERAYQVYRRLETA
jgi:hypothetical protein